MLRSNNLIARSHYDIGLYNNLENGAFIPVYKFKISQFKGRIHKIPLADAADSIPCLVKHIMGPVSIYGRGNNLITRSHYDIDLHNNLENGALIPVSKFKIFQFKGGIHEIPLADAADSIPCLVKTSWMEDSHQFPPRNSH